MSRSSTAIEPPIPPERAGTPCGPRPPWAWSDGARVLLASVAIASAVVLAVSTRDSGRDRDRGRGQPTVAALANRGAADFKLDANTASVEALETLPHIGPTLARRIVEARADGAFRSPRDLQARVRGIGPVTLA
ncbi:MAG: ComEA family DNA-binding protein, partial [Isosphaeraceae bacterium]